MKLDSFTLSLFNRTNAGDPASWKRSVQIIPFDEGFDYKYDIFDVTKVALHDDYPLIPSAGWSSIEILRTSSQVESLPFVYADAQRYCLSGNYSGSTSTPRTHESRQLV